ncbi:MAG: hypothetical protein KY455_10170 [Euryarchaeota archaeon]|nr:hypothetical protein [Euryarchaeota archaeon]
MPSHPTHKRSEYQSTSAEITASSDVSNKSNRELGQVSAEPLTFTSPGQGLVQVASAELVAAGAGTGRLVIISVPDDADTGIRINFGAAATATDYLIGPGQEKAFPTEQAIHAIRAGAVDVTVQLLTAVV